MMIIGEEDTKIDGSEFSHKIQKILSIQQII